MAKSVEMHLGGESDQDFSQSFRRLPIFVKEIEFPPASSRLNEMDAHSFRRYLNFMLPLVSAATRRRLSRDELAELSRLIRLMECGIVGADPVSRRAEALCLALYSSGLFEGLGESSLLPSLLQEVETLRRMLTIPSRADRESTVFPGPGFEPYANLSDNRLPGQFFPGGEAIGFRQFAGGHRHIVLLGILLEA